MGLSLRRGELLTQAGRRWVHSEAWPLLGPEQQCLVETHERLIDVVTEMIKMLDWRIARMVVRSPPPSCSRQSPASEPTARC